MIVDDDPSTRFVLRMILERVGYDVVEAEHGEAALAHLSPTPPDVVTTDLTMPVLNGQGLIERLRAEPSTASIPIVVVSGNPVAARALHAAGRVDAFVVKPFTAVELATCIQEIVSRVDTLGPAA